MKPNKFFFVFAFACLILSCDNDDQSMDTTDDIIDMTDDTMPPVLTDEVEVYETDLIHNGLVLGIENGQTTAYLLNKEGQKLHTWDLADRLGNDFELLPDGRALGAFKVDDPPFSFGGGSGSVKIVNPDNSIDWEFFLVNENFLIHHDVDMLPNGNLLIMVWERITNTDAQQAGINATIDIFPEKLIEVNPTNNEIVWEWRAWDHLIQDNDENLANYGVIVDNPQRIDFNYNIDRIDGDIMHANGLDYDAVNDIIYLSVNFYSEIWVIDHSTTTEEATGVSGGNYNKGGDLLYRFGNPEAYQNTLGERRFYNNHFPNLLEGDEQGAGNILVYVNSGENNSNQSTVYELDIPDTFNLQPNTDNEPTSVWSFTDENLYSGRISGAVRLSNGNTLICEGDYGYWEVTTNGEIVWKYNGANSFWRGYGYDLDYSGLTPLNLDF